MSYVYIITVMLLYAEVDKPKWTFYLHTSFDSIEKCNEFLTDNKVMLAESLIKEFKHKDGKTLKSYEHFCERKEAELEV